MRGLVPALLALPILVLAARLVTLEWSFIL